MKLKTGLFNYQQKAVEKLSGLRVGALFMEMGTGKTRTTLEIINKRINSNKLNHVLWLCPCSVRENLKTDIQKHTDGGLAKIAVYGIESLSSSARLYNLLLKYVQAGETMIIVDESTLVKNHSAIRTQRIISLAQICKYRLILNGTPISRSEADLFSQFYILDWRILGYRSFWRFAANHLEYDEKYRNKVRRVLNVDYLTSKIGPYSYIIKKDDVLKLPDKQYFTKWFMLTSEQKEHYANQRDKFLDTLIDNDDEAAIEEVPPDLLNEMIGQLPTRYRIVVNLYAFGQLSHKDIGQKLDISEKASATIFSRAKRKLAKMMKEYLDSQGI